MRDTCMSATKQTFCKPSGRAASSASIPFFQKKKPKTQRTLLFFQSLRTLWGFFGILHNDMGKLQTRPAEGYASLRLLVKQKTYNHCSQKFCHVGCVDQACRSRLARTAVIKALETEALTLIQRGSQCDSSCTMMDSVRESIVRAFGE